MIFRVCSSITIFGILLWAHRTPESETLTLQTTSYKGIPPIDTKTLPLSTDDIARGLLFNPTISVPFDSIKQTFTYRVEFATLQDKHRSLQIQMGTDTLKLLQEMDP